MGEKGGGALIFFDLDDTLLDHKTTANRAVRQFHEQYSDLLPYSEGEFVEIWYQLANNFVQLYRQGEIGWDELIRRRIQELFQPFESGLSNDKIDKRCTDYMNAYEENWVLFSDALPCLDALNDRTLGVITNGPVAKQNQKLKDLQIHDRFGLVITSEEIGVWKPDPRIFQEACKRAGVMPQSCVYVGDLLENDARASAAAGMRGVWLNRKGGRDKVVAVDIEIIESLSELPGLLQG